jgi:hypothetical protein
MQSVEMTYFDNRGNQLFEGIDGSNKSCKINIL